MEMTEDRKIRVKLNIGGVEVEIECLPEQLNEAITTVVKTVEGITPAKEGDREEFYALTCKEAVEKLWREGWFEKPRKLGEIWDELSRRGYNYDRSAISHALLSLVKEGKLSRIGKARKYQYIQKIPYHVKT
jgi:hypothetical protein